MEFVVDLAKLSSEQRAMLALWEEHLKAEFQDKDACASCDTMVANPVVNHVPVLTGGVGEEDGQRGGDRGDRTRDQARTSSFGRVVGVVRTVS